MNSVPGKRKIAIVYVSKRGKDVAENIADTVPHCIVLEKNAKIETILKNAWSGYDNIICIMAAGIVVRSIANLIQDKCSDPAIVVVDEQKKHVISLLSGHIGGGNSLAEKVGRALNATPVITTASDVSGNTALDLWLQKNNFFSPDRTLLTKTSAKLVQTGSLKCYSEIEFEGTLPHDIIRTDSVADADFIISNFKINLDQDKLRVYPRNLFMGLGCNRNTEVETIEASFNDILERYGVHQECFIGAASIDLKINEVGLLQFCRDKCFPIKFYSKSCLNSVHGVSSSQAVLKATGAKGVCEPASILAAGGFEKSELLIEKQKWPDVTIAVARKKMRIRL